MKKTTIIAQILALIQLFLVLSHGGILQTDQLEDNVLLSPVKNTYTVGQGTFYTHIVPLQNEIFANLYIGDDLNIYAGYSQNGIIISTTPRLNLDDTEDCLTVSGCSFGNEGEMLVLFTQKKIGAGTNSAQYLQFIDKDGNLKHDPVQLEFGNITSTDDQWLGRCEQLTETKIGLVFYIYLLDGSTNAEAYFRTYEPLTGQLSIIQQINIYDVEKQWKPAITKIPNGNGIITFEGFGPLSDLAATDRGIYFTIVEIDQNDGSINLQTTNHLVQNSDSNIQSSIDYPLVEGTEDGGFIIVYNKNADGKIYMASYEENGVEICNLEIADQMKWPTVSVYKDKAYLAVTAMNADSEDYLLPSTGWLLEVDVQKCTTQQTSQFSGTNEVYFHSQITVGEGDNAVLVGVNYVKKDGTDYNLTYSEYLLEQKISVCSNSFCTGCYGSKIDECNMCVGSTADKRQERYDLTKLNTNICECPPATHFENEDQDCELCPAIHYSNSKGTCQACYHTCASCSNGYSCDTCVNPQENAELNCICPNIFYLDSFGVCQACKAQCKSCSNSETCDECKDSNMLIESECLFKKSGNLIIISPSGEMKVAQCNKKCLTCQNTADNCLTCAGQNRDSDQNCACLDGYHDYQESTQDCIKCSKMCISCLSPYRCLKCDPYFNRNLDIFTGKCECSIGFKAFGDSLICEPCYQISDGCVQYCPENTIQNEKTMVCEQVNLSLNSNGTAIIFFGIVIALVQIGLCIGVHMLVSKRYNAYQRVYLEEQIKIQQQRKHIYKDLEKYSMNIDQPENSQINTNIQSRDKSKISNSVAGVGVRGKRRRQVGQASRQDSVNQLVDDLHNSNVQLITEGQKQNSNREFSQDQSIINNEQDRLD